MLAGSILSTHMSCGILKVLSLRFPGLLVRSKPGLGAHISQLLGGQSSISWMLHTSLELALVRNVAEPVCLAGSEVKLSVREELAVMTGWHDVMKSNNSAEKSRNK